MIDDPCAICGASRSWFAEAVILKRYRIRYTSCTSCGFVQTERPYWLDEAYATALVNTDVGAVQRNLEFAETTHTIIRSFFNSNGRFLDYGGGYGLFVRLMRDRGFDFYWSDPHAENCYSRGFEANEGDSGFTLVTAFEVFEHLYDPISEVERMLARGDSILFSTQLLPCDRPKPGSWWYYGLDGGQHVSIYTNATLEALARRLGMHVASNGRGLHLLSTRRISRAFFRIAGSYRVARLVNRFLTRPTLIPSDVTALSASSAIDFSRGSHAAIQRGA